MKRVWSVQGEIALLEGLQVRGREGEGRGREKGLGREMGGNESLGVDCQDGGG